MDNPFENPDPTEKLNACRLVNEEIKYLDEQWGGKFSEYVHHCIKRDIAELQQQKNNKTILFKETGLYVLLIGFGMFFFVLGIKSTILLEIVLSYVIGLFMFIFGTVGGLLYALQSTRRKP
jgi:uncharacterized protein YacL